MIEEKCLNYTCKPSFELQDASIVSDKMLNKVDDLTEANRMIGQLEGELKVANQAIDQALVDNERELEEASTQVDITVTNTGNSGGHRLERTPFGDIIHNITNNPSSIENLTIDKGDLNELADAAVKGQAKKDVDAAEKAKQDAEDKLKIVEKTAKRNEDRATKRLEEGQKELKKSIESAVERAEKQSTREIADLALDVKALHKENTLLVDEKDVLAKERDLALEAMDAQIRLLKKKIEIIENPTSNLLKSIANRLGSYYFNRKINRLEA